MGPPFVKYSRRGDIVVAMRVQLARTKDESGDPGLKLHQTRSGLRGLLSRLTHRTAAQLFGKSSGLFADCDLAQFAHKSHHALLDLRACPAHAHDVLSGINLKSLATSPEVSLR